ncbi:MAG: hypothetical protein GY798_27000 [Hyphomicrobiales bacterium]|nr:hypothetical protein [Hyphomicrobiales bacterium]
MRTSLTSILLFGLFTAMTSAGAHAFERCEPFTVFADHDSHEITFIDVGEEGPSIGDRRVFHGVLQNEAGDPVGRVDGESSVIYSDDEGKRRTIANVVYQFPTGVIIYTITPALHTQDFGDASAPLLPSSEAARIIVGGSGVFAGAWGSVDVIRGDKTSETKVNISCR